jgi:ABC-type uncharacterized transport system YnjBCD ATPase subunit
MSIEVKNLVKRFGSDTVCDNLNLDIPSGELVALLGPSGSGKTSLLRIIAGLEQPDSGTVLFNGEDTTNVAVRERNVGFVFQHYALFGHMSIFENVAFGLRVRPKRPARPKPRFAKVTELLKLVQLDWIADRYPHQLSGGQRQRIAWHAPWRLSPRCCCWTSLWCLGRQGPQGTAPLVAPSARRDAHHQRLRHPRPGRSHGSGRPHRGDEPGPHRTGGRAGRGLRPSGHALRAQVPGRRQPVPWPRPCAGCGGLQWRSGSIGELCASTRGAGAGAARRGQRRRHS